MTAAAIYGYTKNEAKQRRKLLTQKVNYSHLMMTSVLKLSRNTPAMATKIR